LDDRCPTLAASLAYYTIFALPPLLFLLLSFVTAGLSFHYENQEARQRAKQVVHDQATQVLGNSDAAAEIAELLDRRALLGGQWWTSVLSILGILIGATGVVAALQDSLNLIWNVRPDPERTGFLVYVKKRIVSLAMILGLGAILIASLVLSAVVAVIGNRFTQLTGLETNTAGWLNQSITLLMLFVFFSGLFRFMPDARIAWQDVWMGAILTTALFSLGRGGLQYYLRVYDPSQALGSAAASLVVILIWVYYTSMIVLFGAEFTQTWALNHGRDVVPEKGAVRVVLTTVPNQKKR
jgi:membrane protein